MGSGRRHGTFGTTADVGLWARAPDAEGLLAGLGAALYGLMTDPRTVRPRGRRTVVAEGADLPALTVAFLTELLILKETDGFVGRRLAVRLAGGGPWRLTADVEGEPFDPARHPARTEVKAVTLHRLTVDPAAGRARVIVDI